MDLVSVPQLKACHKKRAEFAVFFSLRECMHCKNTRPILNKIAVDGENAIPIVELACEDNLKYVSAQNIVGVPEIRRYQKDGEFVSFSGTRTKKRLASFLKRTSKA